MNSGAPALLSEGLITEKQIEEMLSAMEELQNMPNSVFYYRFIQATAFV
jgi:hypothetical protein